MCSTLTKKIKGLGDLAADYLSPFYAALVNGVLIAVTGGIEQIATIAGYRCPCVNFTQVGVNCTNATIGKAACTAKLNYDYGITLLAFPAIILYILGIGLNSRYWKSTTGIIKRKFHRDERYDSICNVFSVLVESLLYPVAWVAVALLDGKFLACALTTVPYVMQKGCSEQPTKLSNAFKDNETYSETIGWYFISVAIVAGFIAYTIARCSFPLSYHHAQYYYIYRQKEVAEMKRQLKIEAEKHAVANVQRFVEDTRDNRPKELWDKVSTVYEFHRYEKDAIRDGVNHNLDVYSNLDHWVKKERSKDAEIVKGPDGQQRANQAINAGESAALIQSTAYEKSKV